VTYSLFLRKALETRLAPAARQWFKGAAGEIADGAGNGRFCALLSLASRHASRASLAPSANELEQAERMLPGWNPERWTQLETLRVALLLSRPDLGGDGGALALSEAFRYADEGELCALYRSLALLPGPERFTWRAGEGCRTNMRSVFEATALDTPFPARWFDDLAWRQVVVKCLFVGAPLWRLSGLDQRLSAELARMVLDLADERRSAGRPIPHELWACLGPYGGARGLDALEREIAPENPDAAGRSAAVFAFARAGDTGRLGSLARTETDPTVQKALELARSGPVPARAFGTL